MAALATAATDEDLRGAYTALHRAADCRTGFATDLLLDDAARHLRCAGEDALADEAEAAMCGGPDGFSQPYVIGSLLQRVDALIGRDRR